MSGDKLLDAIVGEDRDKADDEKLEAAHLTLYRQHWGRLVPLPGAAELLAACAERGLAVVLASSASAEELAALRSALAADGAITEATSSADADAGKPAPDILQAALEQSGLGAGDVVFVGDARWDGEAAERAGVTFVGVTCGGTPAEVLREAGAVEVWRDPAEVLEHLADGAIGRLRG
jgi:HAD superfamily hydrolase (TIGR01509 family)